MDDLISRRAAIDEINNICPVDTEYDCTLLDRVDVRCVLSDLPAALPERKKGKWISDEDGNIYCSICGRTGVGESFCEHCGANMKGEEE